MIKLNVNFFIFFTFYDQTQFFTFYDQTQFFIFSIQKILQVDPKNITNLFQFITFLFF